jgi:prevent-host-death family protein
MYSPHIITITELRRHTLDIVNGPLAQGIPVYVVQHGWVAAVVMSRTMYERLKSRERSDAMSDLSDCPAADADGAQLSVRRGVESFGPLPRGTLFETPWAMVDEVTADFYMEDGIPVRPHRWQWTDEDRSDVSGVTWTERLAAFRNQASSSGSGEEGAGAGSGEHASAADQDCWAAPESFGAAGPQAPGARSSRRGGGLPD